MAKRKETILKTIEEQGKLTDALKERIENCWDATELDDIYLPFSKLRQEIRLLVMAETADALFQRERKGCQEVCGRQGEGWMPPAKDIIAEMVSGGGKQKPDSWRIPSKSITSKVVAKKKDEGGSQVFGTSISQSL